MKRYTAVLIVLFLTNFCSLISFPLERTELYTVEETSVTEYASQLVLIDSTDKIQGVYDICGNKLVKSKIKDLPELALEEAILVRTGYNIPATHVTVSSGTRKNRTYFVHNGHVFEECPMYADYFISEKEVFAEPDKHHIRIHADSSCYALKETYMQASENHQIEGWKKKYKLQFSNQLLQERVASLAKKCGIREKIAVYEYVEPEDYSYMTFRTSVYFTLNQQKTVMHGAKWIIIINPHHRKELMTAILYHEMGHILHKDPEKNNNQTPLSPAESRELEFQADTFLYKQLLKDNQVGPYIHFFNFLSGQALQEEDYDEATAMHPKSAERAARCLAFVQQHFPLVEK